MLVGGPPSWAALAAPTELALPTLPPAPLSSRDEIDIEALRDGWSLVVGRRPGRRANLGSVARSTTQRATLRSSERRGIATSSRTPYVPLALSDIETTDNEELGHRRYTMPPAEFVDMSDVEYGDFGESGGLADYVDRFARDRAAELEHSATRSGLAPELAAAAAEANAAINAHDAAATGDRQHLLSLRDFLEASG